MAVVVRPSVKFSLDPHRFVSKEQSATGTTRNGQVAGWAKEYPASDDPLDILWLPDSILHSLSPVALILSFPSHLSIFRIDFFAGLFVFFPAGLEDAGCTRDLYAMFPTGEFKNLDKCRPLFPHAKSAIRKRLEEQGSLIEWDSILYKGAWYA
jgi:hypothetical protein